MFNKKFLKVGPSVGMTDWQPNSGRRLRPIVRFGWCLEVEADLSFLCQNSWCRAVFLKNWWWMTSHEFLSETIMNLLFRRVEKISRSFSCDLIPCIYTNICFHLWRGEYGAGYADSAFNSATPTMVHGLSGGHATCSPVILRASESHDSTLGPWETKLFEKDINFSSGILDQLRLNMHASGGSRLVSFIFSKQILLDQNSFDVSKDAFCTEPLYPLSPRAVEGYLTISFSFSCHFNRRRHCSTQWWQLASLWRRTGAMWAKGVCISV